MLHRGVDAVFGVRPGPGNWQGMAGHPVPPEEQSTPIVMAFYQGLTHAQISEDLKVPLGTIKSRIRDGMKKLRDELEASR